MVGRLLINSANTILYCQQWRETVDSYQRYLDLPITFATEWFVEFDLGRAARLSLADETRATIKSGRGAGITLALEVENADAAWHYLHGMGLELEPVRDHAWGAASFLLY